MDQHLLRAKYDRAYEIGCDGCGETWVATDEGFKEAALALTEANNCECTACNYELEDKYC